MDAEYAEVQINSKTATEFVGDPELLATPQPVNLKIISIELFKRQPSSECFNFIFHFFYLLLAYHVSDVNGLTTSISMAQYGDTIILNETTYLLTSPISFVGKSFTLKSVWSQPERTFFVCNPNTNSAIFLNSHESYDAFIIGNQ